jgi:hypothetical protein
MYALVRAILSLGNETGLSMITGLDEQSSNVRDVRRTMRVLMEEVSFEEGIRRWLQDETNLRNLKSAVNLRHLSNQTA